MQKFNLESMLLSIQIYNFVFLIDSLQRNSWKEESYLKPDRDDCATDLFADHELLAEHGQDEIFPTPRSKTLAETDNPLAAVTIHFVLMTNCTKL